MKSKMKKILMLAFFVFGGVLNVFAKEKWTPVQLSVADSLQLTPKDFSVYGIRFGLFQSVNESVYGIDVNPGMTQVNKNFVGFQFHSWNKVGGDFGGMQISPFWNEVKGKFYGFQFAISNHIGKGGTGIQVGITGNEIDEGILTGAQINPLLSNIGNVNGLQVATLSNGMAGGVSYTYSPSGGGSYRKINGVQISGIVNYAASLKGVQIAGLRNKSRYKVVGFQGSAYNSVSDLAGMQIGVFNKINDFGKGIQIGLVNVAEELTGIQIGLININKKGRFVFLPVINAKF